MPLSQVEYLRHIHDEIKFLESKKEGLSKDEFLYEETIKRAFVRSIEIIGEAAKKISYKLKDKIPFYL